MVKSNKSRDKRVIKAILEVRGYLDDEFITMSCVDSTCFGCCGCNAVELNKKLLGLRNFIGDLG